MIENLWEYGRRKRTLQKLQESNEIQYQKPREILQIIKRNKWPYKQDIDFYETRDLALASLLYLSSGRINEVLRLKADQFSVDDKDPDFMLIQNFYVSKRKKGKTHPILEIPLPLKGSLSPFTRLVRDYLKLIAPDEKLFSFGRQRAWAIIRHITNDPENPNPGWFCHWFRAQSLSYQVQLIRSTTSVAKQRGIENPSTLRHYDQGDWRQYKDELKQ